MLREIILHPAPVLRRISEPVTRVTPAIVSLMDDLRETMLHNDRGIGLAAPQVGVLDRVIAVDPRESREADTDTASVLLMANPEIIWASDELKPYTEGCLSIPEAYAEVQRPAEIRVRYLDRDSESRELEAGGLLAVVLQHEIDHLDGKLFIDHLSPLKRDMLLRRYYKLLKANGVAVDG